MSERVLIANASLPCPTNLLDSDERALWWDRPDPQRYALRGAGFPTVFLLFFVGFSIFWMVQASKGGGFFWMFGLIFFGVGSWGLSEPVRRYIQARSVIYLLTDKRAVVADEQVVKSVAIPMIKSIELTRTSGPFADVLYFDRVVKGGENGDSFVRDGFIGITDAEAVAREMRRLQAAAS